MSPRVYLILIVITALVGISASFMPWLHFPKSNSVLYGYVGDGVVSGIVFIFCLVLASYGVYKNTLGKLPMFTLLFAGLLMAYMSYSKIERIELEKINFKHDNPIVAAAFAGAYQGIGVYVFGFAGLGIAILSFLLILSGFFFTNDSDPTINLDNRKKYMRFIALFGGVLLVLGAVYFFKSFSGPIVDKEILKVLLEKEIQKMGTALRDGDYNAFTDYNHQIMQQSMGGREKMTELIKSTMEGMKETGATVSSVTLKEILNVAQEDKSIQVIITQNVIFNDKNGNTTEIQKMLAVSEDSGSTWKFINIGSKSKSQMQQFFPDLNPKLEF